MSAIISSPHGPPQSREDGRCCNEPGEYCTDTAVFLCITCQGPTGRAIISSTTLVVCCQEHPRWVRHLRASTTAGPRRTKSCRRTEHPFFVSARRERGNEKQQPNMTTISFFFFQWCRNILERESLPRLPPAWQKEGCGAAALPFHFCHSQICWAHSSSHLFLAVKMQPLLHSAAGATAERRGGREEPSDA